MALDKDPLNLIITGVGGQGNVLASQIVASAGIKEGLYVTVGETYGASQRGGPVMSHVRFSTKAQCSPLISEGQADIVVGLEPVEALRVMAEFGNPRTRVIVSPRPIYPVWVLSGQATYPPVEEVLKTLEELAETVQVAKVSGGGEAPVGMNVLMVGALAASGLLPIPIETYEEAMREILAPKDLDTNLQIFKKGMQTIAGG
ncbi:MAG: indolepyruvate oxidoreductase subunit beta [Dehalococcoidia bacterium]|nr:MAG: indolepyruvate oxidoreductase subunit beta [Dehalococcoidia bacterium]UCG82001.1 MAG: indolepyruvate oxidoreductase subunit beta [Dehalococcoidia bacterium]